MASRPRSTAGKVVVAPSSTALTVPMIALIATAPNTSRPCSCTVSGPSAQVSPPWRTKGRKSGAEQHQRQHEARAPRNTSRAGMRAATATATSTAAQTA